MVVMHTNQKLELKILVEYIQTDTRHSTVIFYTYNADQGDENVIG